MHYNVNDCVIKSENAALSSKQKNSQIVRFIEDLDNCNSILDYGCGKCRYSKLLFEKSNALTLVDSEIQVNRIQIIHNERTTIREFASKRLNSSKVVTIEEIDTINDKYDFILCSNVLSAIPLEEFRIKALENIYNLLSNNGKALISVQYRNSYFDTYKTNPNAQEHYDGWIIKTGNSYSFYGLIKPDALIDLCENVGLIIKKKILKDGSIYLFLQKESSVL